MEQIVMPRMGHSTDVFIKFFKRLGIDCVYPPQITKKTFELGNERMDELMCVTGDTNITTDDFTSKPIKDIKIDDNILTHKGRFKKVINVFYRDYSGEMINIDCGGLIKLNITPEHSIYSVTRKEVKHKNIILKFNLANELKEGDYIAIPIPQVINIKESLKWKEEYKHQTKYKTNEFIYSKELLKLVGYFLAEGSFYYNRRKKEIRNGICFTFSSKEEEYINEVSKILKSNFEGSLSIYKMKCNATNLCFWNKSLANIFFYLCGEHCDKKTINKELMYLEPKIQMELLKGFFNGDGSYSKNEISCATVSKNLADQLFWLLVRNHIKTSFFIRKKDGRKDAYIFKLNSNDAYNLGKHYNRSRVYYHIIQLNNYILVPIKKIIKKEVKDKVYNLEVEDDNSYVANKLAVHNCFPAKVTMGNFREALDEGHKKLMMWDSCGPCRLKCYWSLQYHILTKLGYKNFEMIPITPKNLIKQIFYLHGGFVNPYSILSSAIKTYKELVELEKPKIKKDKINIGIIGEIYTINCPEANMDIFKKLENLNVGYKNYVAVSSFVKQTYHLIHADKFNNEAAKYMPHKEKIGGHGFQSIKHLLEAIDEGLNGMIHILPFPCSPESVVSPILDIIAEKYNFPLIHLIFDEHTGEAGLETRLEAFVDMIELKEKGIKRFKKVELGQKTKRGWIGLDVGSVSTKAVLLNEEGNIANHIYTETKGDPITATKECLKHILDKDVEVCGIGVTGSSRKLIGKIFNVDLVKNEITAQTIGCLNQCDDIKSLIEIGGQDSKGIILRGNIPIFYNLNSVCAAGTGSFLSHQKERMGFDNIEEFAECGYNSNCPTKISGRCTVFSETDLIHKQAYNKKEDLIAGLNRALVINYLKNVMKNRHLDEPIFFSGGVSCNKGVIKSFRDYLGKEIIVSGFNKLTGAIGIGLLTKEAINKSSFRKDIIDLNIERKTKFCENCGNQCEVTLIYGNNNLIDKFNDRCGNFKIK